MNIQLPQQLTGLLQIFEKEKYDIYIVGGAVRDLLLGNKTYDWDLTTNATPEEMLNIIPEAYYDNQFGTVGVPNEIEGERPYEVTTFRTESGYTDARHPDNIKWGETLEEDLSRREATISAMALKIIFAEGYKSENKKNNINATGELIDPYHGEKDLQRKVFRAVGIPDERYREDALRMIRAIRISAQLGFTIEIKTFEGIQNNASLINNIAKERVRDELIKILQSDYPYEGMILFRNSGLLREILPEMENTFGVEQKSPGRHHIYDVGTHSLLSLKNCPSRDPIVRFATFIHDSGKAKTYKKTENGIITFYNHELVSTNNAYKIAKRLKFSKRASDKLTKLVRWHQFTVDERQTDSAIRRFIKNVTPEYLNDMLDLRVGDRLGGGASESSWRLEEFKKRLIDVQKQPFAVKDLKIDGNDVMNTLGIKPSRLVGDILEKLFDKVVNRKIQNTKDELLKALEKEPVK